MSAFSLPRFTHFYAQLFCRPSANSVVESPFIKDFKEKSEEPAQLAVLILQHLSQISKDEFVKQETKKLIDADCHDANKLDALLTSLWENASLEQSPQLIDFLDGVLSLDRLSQLTQLKEGIDLNKFMQSVKQADCDQANYEARRFSSSDRMFSEWRSDWPVLINYCVNLINLFVDTLDFLNMNKNNLSLWDRQLILLIVAKFILIPGAIIQALSPFLGRDAKVYLVSYSLIALFGLSVYVYQKWMRPVISELSNADNMKKMCLQGRVKHRIVQSMAMKEVANRLFGHLMIVGTPGTGKTALVEAIVQLALQEERLKSGQKSILPTALRDKRFFRVDCKALAAKGFNKVEPLQKMKQELAGCQGQVVLFFDEVHSLLNNEDCFEALKPFLDQKNLICIGATTPTQWAEIKKKYDGEEALSDRWPAFHLPSASDEDTLLILSDFYEKKSREILDKTGLSLLIEKDILQFIIKESKQRLPHKAQPRAAIACLDNVINRCRQAYSSTYFYSDYEACKTTIESREKTQAAYVYEEGEWPTKIDEEMESLQEQKKRLELELNARKQAAARIQDLKKRQAKLRKESIKISQDRHFQIDEKLQKLYLLYRYYLKPSLYKQVDQEIAKFKDSMDFKINQALVQRYFDEQQAVNDQPTKTG